MLAELNVLGIYVANETIIGVYNTREQLRLQIMGPLYFLGTLQTFLGPLFFLGTLETFLGPLFFHGTTIIKQSP